jgi:SAM-dependent methyltransferase
MSANINSASHLGPAGSESDEAEAVNWESRYRLGDTPWEKGVAAPPLIDFLAHHPIKGEILVPGCGAGHEVRALAAQDVHRATVIGLDLAETAITLAQGIPLVGQEMYVQGDLFALPSSWNGRFDWVVEHTCFCAIDPTLRADYVRAIAQVLKPGGQYFAIFFMTPDSEQGPPFETTSEEISQHFDPSFELLEEWVPPRTFEGREGRELCQLRRLRKDGKS